MSYKIKEYPISKEEARFRIFFKFEFQEAVVSFWPLEQSETIFCVESETDGYHWFAYWMAQEPNCKELLELSDHRLSGYQQTKKVFKSLEEIGFFYEPEDKESCYLTVAEMTLEVVERFAQFLEPRFANRERFFPDE